MSKITGIPDFQDFIEKEGIEYLQKILVDQIINLAEKSYK